MVIDFEGKWRAARPSSDTPTHRRLFLAFPTSAASSIPIRARGRLRPGRAGIPCLGTTHADYFYGEVPVTRALTPGKSPGYEWETGNVIVERGLKGIDTPPTAPACWSTATRPSPGGRTSPRRWRPRWRSKSSRKWPCCRFNSQPEPRADRGGAPEQALPTEARRGRLLWADSRVLKRDRRKGIRRRPDQRLPSRRPAAGTPVSSPFYAISKGLRRHFRVKRLAAHSRASIHNMYLF